MRVVTVTRKPILEGAVGTNVMTWQCGALHVDACRIAAPEGSPAAARRASARKSGKAPMAERIFGTSIAAETQAIGKLGRRGSAEVYMAERPSEHLGRWPANVLLDGEPATASLDEQSGSLQSPATYVRRTAGEDAFARSVYGSGKIQPEVQPGYGDQGGASRFFRRLRCSVSSAAMKAPFTDEQVAAIRRWQEDPRVHPLTCGNDRCGADLEVDRDGLRCPRCDYTQPWAPDVCAMH